MRSDEHKAEAERLLHLARTDEGKKADDPGDPLVVLQLAQTHALLAAVPDWADVVDAEVVDDGAWPPEYGELLEWLRAQLEESQTPHDLALHLLDRWPSAALAEGAPIPDLTDLDLTNLLATRSLWTAAQWGNLMLIARDTREAVVLTRAQLVALHGVLVMTSPTPASHTEALEKATDMVDEWVGGFER